MQSMTRGLSAMRSYLKFSIFAVFMIFSSALICYGQVEQPHWISAGADINLPDYRYFSKAKVLDSGGQLRSEYIQRKTDQKPILFYQDERVMQFVLGHQKRLVLMNDIFAVAGNYVVISDLDKNENHRIDEAAFDDYTNRFPDTKGTEPDQGGFITPNAIAISPDDRQVLIHMDLFTSATLPVGEKWYANHPDWSYVVDSADGKILKVYKTKAVPAQWWIVVGK
jgi:hypothetical protein